MRRSVLAGFGILLAVVLAGCTNSRTTDTARTGIEQLLISNAIDQTLDKAAMPSLQGQKVFVEDKYLECVDKGYLVGSLRQRLLIGGAQLVEKKEDSEITVELFSGGVGTDNVDSFVGVPGMAVPAPMPIEIPEIRMFEKTSQFGTAKIGLTIYSTSSGELIHNSGQNLARSDDSRWSVLGVGPFESGSVRNEVNLNSAGAVLPTRVSEVLEAKLR